MVLNNLILKTHEGNFKEILEKLAQLGNEKSNERKLIEIEALIGLKNYNKALNEIDALIESKIKINQGDRIKLLIFKAQCYMIVQKSNEKLLATLNEVEILINKGNNSTIPLQEENMQYYLIKGEVNILNDDFKAGIELYEQCLKVSRKLHNYYYQTKSLNKIALFYYENEQFDNALEYTMKGFAISTANNYNFEVAFGYEMIGLLNQNQNADQALKYLNQFSKIAKDDLKDQNIYARSLFNIGFVLISINKLDEALEYLQRSYTIYENFEYESINLSRILKSIGDIFTSKGKYLEAIGYYKKSFKIVEKSEMKQQQSKLLYTIGSINFKIGDNKTALKNFRESLSIKRELTKSHKMGFAGVLWGLGHVNLIRKNYNKAFTYYHELLEIYSEFGKKEFISEVFLILITLFSFKGDINNRDLYYIKLKDLYTDFPSNHTQVSFNLATAIITQYSNDLNEFLALDLYKKAGFQGTGNSHFKNFSLLNIIRIYVKEYRLTQNFTNYDQKEIILLDINKTIETLVHFNFKIHNFPLTIYSLIADLLIKHVLNKTEEYKLSYSKLQSIKDAINIDIIDQQVNKYLDKIDKLSNLFKLNENSKDVLDNIGLKKLIDYFFETRIWLR